MVVIIRSEVLFFFSTCLFRQGATKFAALDRSVSLDKLGDQVRMFWRSTDFW